MCGERIGAQKHTNVFCVTPRESFDTTNKDISFAHGQYYYAFGITMVNDNSTVDKTLIFDKNFNYVLYSQPIAKRFFEYIENHPIKQQKETELLEELYKIIKIRF